MSECTQCLSLRIPIIVLALAWTVSLALPIGANDVRFLEEGGQDTIIWGAERLDFLRVTPYSGDFNGDGRSDLILWSRNRGGLTEGALHLFFRRSNWPAVIDLAEDPGDVLIVGRESSGSPAVVGVADLNYDGRSDLLLHRGSGTDEEPWIVLFASDPWQGMIDLRFATPDIVITDRSDPVRGAIRQISSFDIDGNGDGDLVVSVTLVGEGYQKWIWYDRPDWPSVLDIYTYPPDFIIRGVDFCPSVGRDLTVDELTGDGLPDLVFHECHDAMKVRLLYGRASWPPLWDIGWNGDGVDSVILVNENGSFPPSNERVRTGDLTGDGLADLVLSYHPANGATAPRTPRATGTTLIYEGSPSIGDEPAHIEILGRDPGDALFPSVIRDVDGDGWADILFEAAGGDGPRHRQEDIGEVLLVRGPLPGGRRDLFEEPADLVLFSGYDGGEEIDGVQVSNVGGALTPDLVIGASGAHFPGGAREDQGLGSVRLFFDLDVTDTPSAEDLYVDGVNGDDAFSGSSWSEAKASPAAALDALDLSAGPATIHVAEGEYQGGLKVGTATRLLGGYPSGGGERDPSAHPTVLAGGESVVTFRMKSREESSHLDGFTVQGGEARLGGGIYVDGEYGSPAIISNNVIRNNVAYLKREEKQKPCNIYESYCVTDCGGFGSGIWVGRESSALITNNLIRDNGVAIDRSSYCGDDPSPPCPLGPQEECAHRYLDSAPAGSVIGAYVGRFSRAGNVVIENNTIVRNEASGINLKWSNLESLDIRDNILFFNANPDVSDTRDLSGFDANDVSHNVIGTASSDPGPTNLRRDPLFVDMEADDFRLSHGATGQVETSPAVDAGSGRASEACLPAFAGVEGLCLWAMTTRTDGVRDTRSVDIGWHVTLPNQPPLFDGVASVKAVGGCTLRVSWEPAEDREGDPVRYNIYRSTSAGGQDLTDPIATVDAPALSYLDEGLSLGTELFYVVRAEDAGGREEGNLVEAAATTDDREAPRFLSLGAAPTGGCAVAVSFEISDACSGLRSWELHRSGVAGFSPGAGTLVATDPATPITDTVETNGNWYYKLRAEDAAGNSATSGQVTARVNSCDATPIPPGEAWILRVLKTEVEIGFEIAPAEGADGHRLYRGDLLDIPSAGPNHAAGLGADAIEGTLDDIGRCRFTGSSYLDPASREAGSFYYLVVGLDDAAEGLYGTDSEGRERPTGANLGTLDCN